MPKLKKRPTGGPPRDRLRTEFPPGGANYGTTWIGGPRATDAFGAKLAPSPYELIERYKSLVFMMVARNRDAVMRASIRLVCDGSRRILGGPPRSACDPIQLPRRSAEHVIRSSGGRISSAAVDQIFEIRHHPMLDVLERPDPYGCFTKRKLIGLMTTYQDVIGHAFLVPDGNGWDYKTGSIGTTAPEYLWVVFPQYCTPYFDGHSPIPLWWQYWADRLPFENLLWFRQSVSLKNPYGASYSPTYAGTQYADQEDRLNSVLDQSLGMAPLPAVIATAKDATQPPGDIERKRLEQDFIRRNAFGNSGGLHVNNGAWDFNVITRPPTDLGAKDMSEYDLYRLAGIFGQPVSFWTTETNLANSQAAEEQHAKYGVEPRLWAITEALTGFVQKFDPRLYFITDPVLAEDEEKMARVNKIYWDMGCRTADQINEESKYPKAPWGAEPLFPKTMLPWSILVKQAEQGIEQGKVAMDSQKASIENEAAMTAFQTTPEPDDEEDAVRSLMLRVDRSIATLGRRESA